jgi:hypothetical protein
VTWCFEPADQISACPQTATPVTAFSSWEPPVQDVEDEPLFAERAAGIDIAKAGIEVTIRVPGDTAGRPGARTARTPSGWRHVLVASPCSSLAAIVTPPMTGRGASIARLCGDRAA